MCAEDLPQDDQAKSGTAHSSAPEDTDNLLLTGTIGPGGAFAGTVISSDRGTEVEAATTIAAYSLVRLIGHGGMGEVWLADQIQPVRRHVALKLIKAGMDTREVIARFESERRVLALMDHPSIAKVFDAGSTPQGRPYFVMEYVNGIPITEYCDKHKLTVRQRLELFVRVCEGVQHAHQKAILHRDLKPSNILVSEVDGKPVPRIIDFGLSKATSQQLTAGEMFTRVGAVVGTPGYMSPEQARSAAVDLDTRTDVYSLGVVLYELLVAVLPLDVHKTTWDEFLKKLREEDTPRPSTRLRGLARQSRTAVENRGTDVPTLTWQLRGDLDAITLKALEKDRSRRYGTPLELAADITRYLSNQPVLARPATVAYRARKYVRRHRIAAAAAAFAAVLLISFAVAQTFQLRRTTRERDRANRVTAFMTGMFRVSNPSEARGNTITAREILDKSSKEIDTGLAKDPELQAQMMYVMGDVYEGLGLYSKAESLARGSVDIRRRSLGAANTETLSSMFLLADVLRKQSREPEAEKLCRETLEARRRVLGPEHRDTLSSMTLLGNILDEEGRYPEAEKLNNEVAETAKRVYGRDDKLTATAMHHLAIDFAYQGKLSDAEKIFRDILESDRRRYGADHPEVLGDMNNLAACLQQQQRFAEAEKIYADLIQADRRVLGPEHPTTLVSMGNLALTLSLEKHYADAEKLFREALEIKRRVLGPEHRSTLVTMGNLADVLRSEGRYPESEQLFRETLEITRRTLGESHSDYLNALQGFGELLESAQSYNEAERVLRDTLEGRRRVLGDGHPDTAAAAYILAGVLSQEGKREEAFSTLQYALEHELSSDVREGLEKDVAFKSLHGDARFDALVASSRQRTAAVQK